MKLLLISKLKLLEEKYESIKLSLQQLHIISDQKEFQKLLIAYKKLHRIIEHFQCWSRVEKDISSIQDFLQDPEMHDITREELAVLYKRKDELEKNIFFLLSQEEDDNRGCLLEIRAGTGGDEASLFCEKLFRMYSKFSEIQRWPMEIINVHNNEYGGYKEIITKISYKGVYGRLKFESGGHRVQRIPETENQGRIHTSTCTVAVIPEYSKTEFPKINPSDLRIDTFRSSGAGGQHVNTTDSAIRITHIPSGLVVECQNERSQHKNKSQALEILSSRLLSIEKEKKKRERSIIKRALLGSGDRSDRIRTYNFPKGRVTDHRIGLTTYRLEDIMEGNLDILICPLLEALKIQKSLSNKIFYEEF